MTRPARTLSNRALALLARREHTRAELARKLAPHVQPDDDVDALLDRLESTGLLSDRRYAEQMAHRSMGRHGSLRLEQKLKMSGVTEEDLAPALDQARVLEPAAARTVLRRRFGTPPASREEWAAQARYLHNRGFRPDVIHQVLRSAADEDSPA